MHVVNTYRIWLADPAADDNQANLAPNQGTISLRSELITPFGEATIGSRAAIEQAFALASKANPVGGKRLKSKALPRKSRANKE